MSPIIRQPNGPILADSHLYRFAIRDRDSIFSASLDLALKDFGVRVLKMPVRAPRANAFCERLVESIRRECLDYLIPINERHLRLILTEFVATTIAVALILHYALEF